MWQTFIFGMHWRHGGKMYYDELPAASKDEAAESFFHEKAAASAEANAHLVPVYKKYFGQPLLERARNLLLHDGAEQDFEDVKQSASSAVVIVREHFRLGDIRRRYHLAAIGESW